MIKVLLVLLVLGAGVGAAYYFKVIPKFPSPLSFLPKISNPGSTAVSLDDVGQSPQAVVTEEEPSQAETPTGSIGKVAGIATEKLGSVGSALSGLVTTQGGDEKITIDVQNISDQIGAQMEKLPAEMVQRAKVAYCQQVLIDATRSATSH